MIYVELPYGGFLFSPFSTSKIPASGSNSFRITDSPSKSQISDNVTTLNPPTSYDGHALNIDNYSRASKENDTDPYLGIAWKPGRESNMLSGSNESDKSSILDGAKILANGSTAELGEDRGWNSDSKNLGMNNLTSRSGERNSTSISEHKSGSSYINSTTPFPAMAPTYQTPSVSPPTEVNKYFTTPAPELPNNSIMPSVSKDNMPTSKNKSLWSSLNDDNTVDRSSSITVVPPVLKGNISNSLKNGNHELSPNDVKIVGKNSSTNGVPDENKGSSMTIPEVLSISEMNTLLIQSHASHHSMVMTIC